MASDMSGQAGMGIPKTVEEALDGPTPSHNGLIEWLREHSTARVVKFRPRTRAILTLVGSTFVIIGWLTPWYVSMVWLNTGSAMAAALRNGYQVTNVSGHGDLIAQGLTPLIREYNGSALITGPSVLSSIAFSRYDFDCWIGLAVLAVLAMWTYERPDLPGVHVARRRIHKMIESGSHILLLFIVFRSLWKGIDLGTLGTVNQHSLTALTDDFSVADVPASAVHDFTTTFSVGLILLVVGLIFAVLGVMSGDKAPKSAPDGSVIAAGPTRIRLKSWNAAFIAILAIMILYALFQG